MPKIFLILHNIRSVHNVGSLFRTADAIGVSSLYLTGFTPTPVDRFGRARKDLAKVSLGAQLTVPWEQRKSLRSLLRALRSAGARIVALEQHPRAIDYKKLRVKKESAIAVVVGNEVSGIPESILTLCDTIAEIPMRGRKESLNASVAAGIFLFRLFDRKKF